MKKLLRLLFGPSKRRIEYQQDYVEKLEEAAQRFPGIYDEQLKQARAELERMSPKGVHRS